MIAKMDETDNSISHNYTEKIKLKEINSYLTCHLCKGYLIDATTISECLHSFCRSCIIKFLEDKSHCPVCEVIINKAKPNLKLDKTLQDIVYKLVPELFRNEMCRRRYFHHVLHPNEAARVTSEQRGEDIERLIFNATDKFSLSVEYISDDSTPGAIPLSTTQTYPAGALQANGVDGLKPSGGGGGGENAMKRYLQCPGMCRIDVLKKFVRNKYNVDTQRYQIDILYKRVPLPDHYTLIDIAYIYSWKRNEPMKFFFRITDIKLVKERFDYLEPTVMLHPPPTGQQNGKAITATTIASTTIITTSTTTTTMSMPSPKPPAPPPTPIRSKVVTTTLRKTSLVSKAAAAASLLPSPVVTTTANSTAAVTTTKSQVPVPKKSPTINNSKTELPLRASSKRDKTASAKSVRFQTTSVVASTTNNTITSTSSAITTTPKITHNHNSTTSKSNNNNNASEDDSCRVITKIQKVSNKNGQPIGLNIIKQTVKKKSSNSSTATTAAAATNLTNTALVTVSSATTTTPNVVVDSSKHKSEQQHNEATATSTKKVNAVINDNSNGDSNNKVGATTVTAAAKNKNNSGGNNNNKSELVELDHEKERFLKSIELTARSVLKTIADTQKSNAATLAITTFTNNGGAVAAAAATSSTNNTNNTTKGTTNSGSASGLKRKLSSVVSPSRDVLINNHNKPKKMRFNNANSSISNSNQNNNTAKVANNKSSAPATPSTDNLKNLLNTCKIPSSLSITCVNGDRETQIKPVINHIEILKLPEVKEDKQQQQQSQQQQHQQQLIDENKQKLELEKVGTTMQLAKDDVGKETASPISSSSSNNKSELSITIMVEKPSGEKAPAKSPTKSPSSLNTASKSPQISGVQTTMVTPSTPPPPPAQQPPLGMHPNLPKIVTKSNTLIRNATATTTTVLNPTITTTATSGHQHTFQKMFEDSLKKMEAIGVNASTSPTTTNAAGSKTTTTPVVANKNSSVNENVVSSSTTPINNNSINNNNNNNNKRNNILEIASQLSKKKTKMEQEKNEMLTINGDGKVLIPRLNTQKTLKKPKLSNDSMTTSTTTAKDSTVSHLLHSPKLGMNYSVSINQNNSDAKPTKSVVTTSPPKLQPTSPSKKHTTKLSSETNVTSTSPGRSSTAVASSPPTSTTTTTALSSSSSASSSTSTSSPPQPQQQQQQQQPPKIDPNQLLEKYNIQNLAQLTASFNFANAGLAMSPAANQLAALQQAMILKRLGMQNRQSWLSMNANPMVQYEKFLQSLSATTTNTGQNH